MNGTSDKNFQLAVDLIYSKSNLYVDLRLESQIGRRYCKSCGNGFQANTKKRKPFQ